MGFYGVSPVLFESVSSVTATNSVELGSRAVIGGNEYVYAYNTGNAQISQGQMGFLPAATHSSQYSVTVSNAASQSGGLKVVGVAHNATITTGAYGWLLVKGLSLVALDASEVSMNSGVELCPGVDGGFVAAAGTSNTAVRLGISINSIVTTVGTGKAFFQSPIFG